MEGGAAAAGGGAKRRQPEPDGNSDDEAAGGGALPYSTIQAQLDAVTVKDGKALVDLHALRQLTVDREYLQQMKGRFKVMKARTVQLEEHNQSLLSGQVGYHERLHETYKKR